MWVKGRWWQILYRGWHFHLPFHATVFIWRVVIGGLLLRSVLKRRELGYGACFFCTIALEDNTSRFIKCPTMHIILKYLFEIWQVLTRCYLRLQQWVFAHYVQNGSNDEMEILFQCLRCQGLQHNWNMHNAFMFDGRPRVKSYVKELKGFLMRKFWML